MESEEFFGERVCCPGPPPLSSPPTSQLGRDLESDPESLMCLLSFERRRCWNIAHPEREAS